MADVKLNSLATKTNANAAAILVKDSATQNQGAEGWITKAQLSQIIRDELKAQMSAITSGTPDVPVLDGNTLKYMTLANFAKVAGVQVGIDRTISFGLTEGESLTISISYGMLLIRDLATGGGALYPILNGTVKTPVYTYYNDNDGYYSVERVNAASVKITRNKTTNGQLRVLVLIA